MQQHIYLVIVFLGSAFWCLGFRIVIIKVILEEIMGLDFFESWPNLSWQLKVLMKPFFACPYCMASIHGTLIFFTLLSPVYGWGLWVPFCITLAGFNYFISQFLNED